MKACALGWSTLATDGRLRAGWTMSKAQWRQSWWPKTALWLLGALASGDEVNLERSLLPTTRLGGHFLQGHVDATGAIKSFTPDKDALWLAVECDPALMRYIVTKGYIAIDGASLTVVDTGENWFNVTLINYTQQKLALPRKKAGEQVNLEVDILAKYVERLLAHDANRQGDASSVNTEFLKDHGFLKKGAR